MHDYYLAGRREDLERKRVSAHEAGHCLFAWFHPRAVVHGVVYQLTDTMNLGATLVEWDLTGEGPELVFDQICLYLAGIAAEAIAFGKFWSNGAGPDLLSGRQLAERLRAMPGWTEPIYRAWREYPGPNRLDVAESFTSPPVAAVRQILRAGYRLARGRLTDRPELFSRLRALIFANSHLDRGQLQGVLGLQPSGRSSSRISSARRP